MDDRKTATTSLIEAPQNDYQSMDNVAISDAEAPPPANPDSAKSPKLDAAGRATDKTTADKGFKAHRYAVNKSVGQGVTNVALVTSNASQLKSVINGGPEKPYYYFFIVGLSASIGLQVLLGYMLVWSSSRESKLRPTANRGTRKTDKLNQIVLYVIFAISFINIILNSFSVGSS